MWQSSHRLLEVSRIWIHMWSLRRGFIRSDVGLLVKFRLHLRYKDSLHAGITAPFNLNINASTNHRSSSLPLANTKGREVRNILNIEK